jgi:hypothetical protein
MSRSFVPGNVVRRDHMSEKFIAGKCRFEVRNYKSARLR